MPYATFERFELNVPQHIVDSVPRSGAVDNEINFHVYNSEIIDALDDIGAEKIRDELREYGAWEDDELADEKENRARLLWIAVGNIQEEQAQ